MSPPEYASAERLQGVESDLRAVQLKQEISGEKIHNIDVKTAEQAIQLSSIDKKLTAVDQKQDQWGWALLGFGFACAGTIFAIIMKFIAAGGS